MAVRPVTIEEYKRRMQGLENVPMGDAAKNIQAKNPSVSQITAPITDVVNAPMRTLKDIAMDTRVGRDYQRAEERQRQLRQKPRDAAKPLPTGAITPLQDMAGHSLYNLSDSVRPKNISSVLADQPSAPPQRLLSGMTFVDEPTAYSRGINQTTGKPRQRMTEMINEDGSKTLSLPGGSITVPSGFDPGKRSLANSASNGMHIGIPEGTDPLETNRIKRILGRPWQNTGTREQQKRQFNSRQSMGVSNNGLKTDAQVQQDYKRKLALRAEAPMAREKLSAETSRRGQDLTAKTSRRGQDLLAETTVTRNIRQNAQALAEQVYKTTQANRKRAFDLSKAYNNAVAGGNYFGGKPEFIIENFPEEYEATSGKSSAEALRALTVYRNRIGTLKGNDLINFQEDFRKDYGFLPKN